MTYEELRKAEELKKDIENLKECVDYFSPVTNGKYFSFVFGYQKKTTRQQIVNCTYKVMEEENQYGLIRNLLTIVKSILKTNLKKLKKSSVNLQQGVTTMPNKDKEPMWCEDCKHFCNADMGGEGECDLDNHDTWYGCPACKRFKDKEG